MAVGTACACDTGEVFIQACSAPCVKDEGIPYFAFLGPNFGSIAVIDIVPNIGSEFVHIAKGSGLLGAKASTRRFAKKKIQVIDKVPVALECYNGFTDSQKSLCGLVCGLKKIFTRVPRMLLIQLVDQLSNRLTERSDAP
jgi:hypothetical protein